MTDDLVNECADGRWTFPASSETAHCCVCDAFVDTRAVEDGGDTDGRQMDDGAWVCSSECWDAAQ